MPDSIFPVQVWIEDTDFGGVVYHANYLKYFERARSAWVDALQMGIKAQQAEGVLFAVRKATLDYKKPARLSDALEVISRITRIGRASVDFSQTLHLAGQRERERESVLCAADIRVACITPDIKPRPLPADWRRRLQAVCSV